MDVLTKKQRSFCMSQIKGKDTKAEVKLRKQLWDLGLRGYRLHGRKITGNPDIYFPTQKLAIFIDGCFWHRCPKCYIKPKTNSSFWKNKIQSNVDRDKRVDKEIRRNGIRSLRIWEHEMKKAPEACIIKVVNHLK